MRVEVNATREGETALLRAMRRVMRPIARILLSHRIGFRQASEVLKQAFVDAALDEVVDDAGEPSISRLSLYTGIHRKEVKRLRDDPLGSVEVPKSVAQGVPILNAWTRDSRFTDELGRPLALARNRRAEGRASFADLVRSVTSDVHARTVLDEWLRLGLVRETPEGWITLTNAAFVPIDGLPEKLFYFERNLQAHLGVAAANLASPKDPMFERSLQVSDLPPSAIRELERVARREGMRALEAVQRRAQTLREERAHDSANDGGKRGEPRGRINFGLYFFRPEPDRGEGSRD